MSDYTFHVKRQLFTKSPLWAVDVYFKDEWIAWSGCHRTEQEALRQAEVLRKRHAGEPTEPVTFLSVDDDESPHAPESTMSRQYEDEHQRAVVEGREG